MHYVDGEKRYMLAPDKLRVGQTVMSGDKVEPEIGNCMPIKNIPLGLDIHNIELRVGQGGQIGAFCGWSSQIAGERGRIMHILCCHQMR